MKTTAIRLRFAFTILEMLVCMTILALMLVVVASIVNQMSSVTKRGIDKISTFQAARAAFDVITSNLSQATLNSYWDYDNPSAPTKFLRQSQLNFIVGKAGVQPFPGTVGSGNAVFFQAPIGMTLNAASYGSLEGLLNSCGYYVEYGNEVPLPSPFHPAPAKYRYRLMQAIQPTESFGVYSNTTGNSWVSTVSDSANSASLADNVVYFAIWPRLPVTEDAEGKSLTSDFSYDSRLNSTATPQPETANQLPPLVQVTMVAIDESSAARFCVADNPPTIVSGAFSNGSLFTKSSQTDFDADLNSLKTRLSASHINYRIFTALVPMRESKME